MSSRVSIGWEPRCLRPAKRYQQDKHSLTWCTECRVAVAASGSHAADRGAELATIALRCRGHEVAHSSQGSVIGGFETDWFSPDRRQRFRVTLVRARRKQTWQPPDRLICDRHAVLHRANRKTVSKTLHNVPHLPRQDVKIVLSELDGVRLGIGRCWSEDEQKRRNQKRRHCNMGRFEEDHNHLNCKGRQYRRFARYGKSPLHGIQSLATLRREAPEMVIQLI